jgi:hypothetical protein
MLSQIQMDQNEHQNDLEKKLDQSKEKNPANESYKPILGNVKRIISM